MYRLSLVFCTLFFCTQLEAQIDASTQLIDSPAHIDITEVVYSPSNLRSASSATLLVTNVNDTGAGSLRNVITGAASGDTILFSSAIDGDSIKLSSGQILISAKDLFFLGNGPENTIIDGSLDSLDRLFDLRSGADITMKNLTLQNGGGPTADLRGGGIQMFGSPSLTLIGCHVFNHQTNRVFGGGFLLMFDGTAKMVNCIFKGNKAVSPSGDGGVAWIQGTAQLTVQQSLHIENESEDQASCYTVSSGQASLHVSQSTFSNNGGSGSSVLFHQNNADVTVDNNIIHNNNNQFVVIDNGQRDNFLARHNLVDRPNVLPIDTLGNFIGDPYFVDPLNDNYQLSECSEAVDAGDNTLIPIDSCDVDEDGDVMEQIEQDLIQNSRIYLSTNVVDLGVYERNSPSSLYIVQNTNDSGPGSLREYISCASSGDTIMFSSAIDGDSIQLSSGQIQILAKNLLILGNGSENTIIDGSLDSLSRLFDLRSGADITIKNLTLQNGGGPTADIGGGGIQMFGNTNLNLIGCDLLNNQTNRIFGGGFLFMFNGNAKMVNCFIKGNKAVNASGSGGVAWLQGDAQLTVQQCLHVDNQAESFGSCYIVLEMENSLQLSQSTISNGGGSTNNVIYHQDTARVTIDNNIIYGNSGQVAVLDNGVADNFLARHNLVDLSGVIPLDTMGNFVGNPFFVDPLNDNYALLDSSEAINAGLNSLIPIDSCDVDADGNTMEPLQFDITGFKRIDADTVDLGTYERCTIFCPCATDTLVLDSPLLPAGLFHAGLLIESNASVSAADAQYKAGQSIVLKNDFEVALGIEFDAVIEPCQ